MSRHIATSFTSSPLIQLACCWAKVTATVPYILYATVHKGEPALQGALPCAGMAAAQRARGAAGSGLQPISTPAKPAPRQSSPAGVATAQELAVRQAALASLHKGQQPATAAPVSPRQPQPQPVLKLRSTVQQVMRSTESCYLNGMANKPGC